MAVRLRSHPVPENSSPATSLNSSVPHWSRRGALAGAVLAALFASASAPAQAVEDQHAERMAEGLELFRSEVGPTLTANCLPCHGGGQTMGGLDLSSRGALVASGKIGETAAGSALLAVLRHEREPFMPFGQAKLPDTKIAQIARWIDLGAPFEEPLASEAEAETGSEPPGNQPFWSFRPLADPQPPQVDASVRTPIDRFIVSRLQASGIEPNPPADRRTLIRRAWLNLIGLPPSPEAVEAFVVDTGPGAYERMVDDLLESPHYGERWARHWMDIARFAESHGFEEDFDRPYAFHYRDFLIKAFNRDMPFDRFVRLQLAGDELEPENPLALMATGFLGAGAFPTQITEAEFETARYDELDDMIGTLGTAMLGLTVGCARCHDHKHDPISARDYYGMAAVFGKTTRTEIEYDPRPGEYRRARKQWETQRDKLREQRRAIEEVQSRNGFREWLAGTGREIDPGDWQVLEIVDTETESDATTDRLDDGSVLVSGDLVDFDSYTFTARISRGGIRALRVEALAHPTMPLGGPGRSRDGQFNLDTLRVEARPTGDAESEPAEVEIERAIATDELNDNTASITASVETGRDKSGWTIRPEGIGSSQAAILEFSEPLGFAGGTEITVKMRFGYNRHFNLGRVRLSVTDAADARFDVGKGAPQAEAEGLAALRADGPDSLSSAQRAALLRRYSSESPEWLAATASILEHESAVPVSTVTRIQGTGEGFTPALHSAAGKGYPYFYEVTHLLSRGDPSQKVEPMKPAVLPVLAGGQGDLGPRTPTPPPGWTRSGLHRTALARWITDPDQGAGGLLARVIVNRLWHHHFGVGIVATPSNFGQMGARPSHPDLLEWLARDLVSNGWRLKRTHRLIMTSSVYMASSSTDANSAAADSSNRLRWRWTPRRLEAEAIRDSLLSVAGTLDSSMYGPGTLSEQSGRRSLYFFIKRSELIPSMMLFDWPEHLVGIGSRPSTTIAPQALQFLNSPQARRYAEGFARRLAGLDLDSAIRQAYALAFARPPAPEEVSAGLGFLRGQSERYATDGWETPDRLAMLDYCQSLLSLNEFLYVR